MLGYPQTAVKAFSKALKEGKFKELMLVTREWWKELSSSEKKKLLEGGVLNFLNFTLSKDNWHQELEKVRKWQEILKQKAPKLYQEIMEKKPEIVMTEEERREKEKEEAEKELKAIREKIEEIKDALGKPIEKGIKEASVMLNAFGLRTEQSCQGHFEKRRKVAPWVLIHPKTPPGLEWTENKEIREKVERQSLAMRYKLTKLLTMFYQERKASFDAMLNLKKVGYGFKLESIGAEVLKKFPEDEQKEKFLEYRREMREFTKFLKKNYPDYLFKRLNI